MRIAHNIMALNTWRNLGETNRSLSKTLERLSSGLRINRAADDAAGLAISEKMRAQIRGLNMAAKNAQDGISLIQTAEGALNEYHAILQRMRELAGQAASQTLTDQDRAAIQAELDQLIREADRIATTTEFNRHALLDGTFQDRQLHIGANANQVISVSIGSLRVQDVGAAWSEGSTVDVTAGAWSTGLTDVIINGITIDLSGATSMDDVLEAINKQSALTGVTASQVEKTTVDLGTFTGRSAFTLTLNGVAISVDASIDTNDELVALLNQVSSKTGVVASTDGTNIYLTDKSGSPIALTVSSGTVFGNVADTNPHTYEAALRLAARPGTSTITVGGTDVADLGLTAGSLALNQYGVNTVDARSVDAAETSIVTLDYAIRQVSEQRASLGALQNRLEHTINNLNVAAENLSAAESRIRDADMAQEMMNFIRQQILLQSGTAMLAQANAVPQTVLQLLA